MPSFTCITNFRGGTYISQFDAPDMLAVVPKWKEHVVEGKYIPNMDMRAFEKAYAFYFEEFKPSPYRDVTNVWGFDFLVGGAHLLELFIIQTDVSLGKESTEGVSEVKAGG
jgi:hypothetical protein